MEDFTAAAAIAVWLGILTSISPCPLASNIAAVTFITKNIGETKPTTALWSGACYVLGRLVTYVLLAVVLVGSVQSVPDISFFLQKYMNKLLGPLLVLVGMFLLDLISLQGFGNLMSQKTSERLAARKFIGSVALGALFALSFCPVSAALYFGSLLPLAIKHQSSLALPAIYAIGTGLPVLVFAVIVVFSVESVGKAFRRTSEFGKWAKRITGLVFVGVGIYYALNYIFEVF